MFKTRYICSHSQGKVRRAPCCSPMPSWSSVESMVDGIFLDLIRSTPQILLVLLVVFVLVMIAKDIINGLRRPFLKPDEWQPLPLADRKETTHNTRLFRFALPHIDQQLGLPIGQHITLKVTGAHGEEILRSDAAGGIAWVWGGRTHRALRLLGAHSPPPPLLATVSWLGVGGHGLDSLDVCLTISTPS